MTVLIVDDDQYIRTSLQKLFSCETRTASSIRHGLAAASEWQPSVIVLDTSFGPGRRNGIDAIGDFKTACPRAQIVIYSALCSDELQTAALKRGAIAYVEKGHRESEKELLAAVSAARELVTSCFPDDPSEVH